MSPIRSARHQGHGAEPSAGCPDDPLLFPDPFRREGARVDVYVPRNHHTDDDRIDIQAIQQGSEDREPDDLRDLVEQFSVTTNQQA